jgi:asparagine synthase (glutamine-hydrolysing)
MCGIIGSINYQLPDKTVQLIRHRGPDGFGIKEVIVNANSVQLFHHRLSIVDLSSNGSQPMESSDGQGVITFNGEIYNHSALREAMQNTDFRGHSDTETLVNLCRVECSQSTLSLLNGIFSFAYLDLQQEKLYLARDRFGVKPLYYCFKENQVIFSSELRAIVDVVGQTFSIGSITTAFEIRHIPAPATMFKNIFKVEPGQLITIDLNDTLSMSQCYFADLPKRKRAGNTTRQQLVNEYGQMLEKAVERQLMADVEVGVLLSGGVDSSLIAAIARSKVEKIKAFTVGFDDKVLDERQSARETAAYLKIDHYSAEVKFDDFFDDFERIINIVEEPVDGGSIFPMYTLSKLASSKVKVVLSGQGADEPLGGYTKYKALPAIDFLAKTKISPFLFRFCSRYIRHKNLRRILSCAGSANNLYAYFEFNSLFGDQALNRLINKKETELITSNYYAALRSFHDVLRSKINLPSDRGDLFTYLDTRTKLPETLLNYTDKITMHFGLECRVPMLDNDLVAFIESIPREHKFSFRKSKIIHKAFAQEYLPLEMIHRKKLAFHGPTKSYIRNNAMKIRDWLIHNDNKLFWQIFDKGQIVQLINEHAQFGNREKELILVMSTLFLTTNKKEELASV